MEKASEEPIRVLQIGMHDQRGGIENYLMNYYRAINKKQVQFDFLIPYINGSPYDTEIEQMGGKVYRLSFKNDNNLFKFIKQVKQIYRNTPYDIIHCNDTGLGLIYLSLARRYSGAKRIAHSHASNMEPGIKGIVKKLLVRPYIQYADEYFSCSKKAAIFMFNKRPYHQINNSIRTEDYYFNEESRKRTRKSLGISDECTLIGSIGRLCKQKNQLFMIDVFNRYHRSNPQSALLLIGSGPLEDSIRNKIRNLKLEKNIIVLNEIRNTSTYYSAMDIFLLTSLYEGLPIVAIEAQANGLPLILADTISREVDITHNTTFVSLGDSMDNWNKAIKRSLGKRLHSNPRISSYDSRKQAKHLVTIYRSILNEQ